MLALATLPRQVSPRRVSIDTVLDRKIALRLVGSRSIHWTSKWVAPKKFKNHCSIMSHSLSAPLITSRDIGLGLWHSILHYRLRHRARRDLDWGPTFVLLEYEKSTKLSHFCFWNLNQDSHRYAVWSTDTLDQWLSSQPASQCVPRACDVQLADHFPMMTS